MSEPELKLNVNNLRAEGFRVRVTHYRRYLNYDGMKLFVYSLTPKDVNKPLHLNNHNDFAFVELPNVHSPGLKWALPHGGKTYVTITDPDNKYHFTGTAKCSVRDQYCKREGVQLALNRAMQQYINEPPVGKSYPLKSLIKNLFSNS